MAKIKVVGVDEVTEGQFRKYVAVQKSGVTNMCDIGTVKVLSRLTDETIRAIMHNYEALANKFPSVVED